MPATELPLKQLKDRLKGLFVVTDQNVKALYGEILPDDVFVIPAGEDAKTLDTVQCIATEMLRRGVNRSGCIAAVGGGVTGDVTGFAAATYMRGIDWINVPTTLLAFADSAIGGKTGVNLSGRKNILGAFHSPKSLIHCYEFLDTLPDAEYKNGMAEVIKTALLDKAVYDLVTKRAPAQELIPACLAVKEAIVGEDYYDNGLRHTLNMGHTVGHAVELIYGLRHGESVAIGLRAEQAIAGVTEKGLAEWTLEQTEPLIKSIDWDCDKIAAAAMSDKKNDGAIKVIAPVSVGKTHTVEFTKNEFTARLRAYIERL